jgi:hypothetical protein
MKSKKEVEKVNFDLSSLSLKELIEVYEEVVGFIEYLEDKKIVKEEVSKDE